MGKLQRWLWHRKVENVEVVYELKPGGHYLIEYSARAVPRKTVREASQWLQSRNIDVFFVENSANHRAFEPVPATPKGTK